jgi:Predicted dehydrogenases and related proteins
MFERGNGYMDLLRVGVIGAGFIGQQHIEAIRRIPKTEVVAIADNDKRIVENKCEQLGIANGYADYKEMLDNTGIDIIHNCTPNNMHYSLNKDIIRKGKHVYCEKPLAISAYETGELVKLAEEYGVAHGVNFNYRQNSMVQEMHQRVKSGDIGRIFMVHGQYLQDWLLYDTDYDWRMDPLIGGVSRAVADIGSHWFDTVQFVTGKRIAAVFADFTIVHSVRKRSDKKSETFSSAANKNAETCFTEIPVASEDAAFIIVRFEDDSKGTLVISQVSAGRKNDLRLVVDGSSYSMEWQQEIPDRLWLGYRDEPNRTVFSSPKALTGDARRYATLPSGHSVSWHDALRNGIYEFYESIRRKSFKEEEQSYATFQDGHNIVCLVEACLESSKINGWVNLKLL